MRRALLVDVDDTIVDWIGPATDAVVATVARHRSLVGVDPTRLANRFLEIVEETHRAFLDGAMTADDVRAERIRRLADEHGGSLGPEEAASLARDYRAAYLRARRPVDGAPELLRAARARGVRTVAVTNNLVAEQEDKLAATGMRELLDGLVVSEAVGAAKPDPRIFDVALDAAGCDAADAVMVGDSWANDVVGACNRGIAAAWLNRRGAPMPAGDDLDGLVVLHSLRPTEAVLDRLLDA